MKARTSFAIILRFFFVLFSIKFLQDAFNKWDGYSYYMGFAEFLPELSLTYILWSLLGVISAFVFWLIVFAVYKILPENLRIFRVEDIFAFLLFLILIYFVKKTFFDISLSELFGLNHKMIIIIGGVLLAAIIWFLSKKFDFEKILKGVNARLTPVLWIFILLLVLAVPFSYFKIASSAIGNGQSSGVYGTAFVTKRPNIILVSMDTLSARNMHMYGYDQTTTPFISKWARNNILFRRAYASSNWTTPTTMTMMTGQRPWTHRAWYLAHNNPIINYRNNLPYILKNSGYSVYGFVQNNHAHPDTLGIKEAFSVKDRAHTFWLPPTWFVEKSVAFGVNRPIAAEWFFWNNPVFKFMKAKLFRNPIYITSVLSETVYNRFLEFISLKQDLPFFAWIHVYPPHILYLPPEPYMGMFGDEERYNTDDKQLESNLIDTNYNPERQKDVDILRKRYDEFILYSDQKFRSFLNQLKKTVDMSNTVIIFTSDHGESFSHGYVGHGHFELYEPLVHIPLIVSIPDKTEGLIINEPVDQADIAPTILELAGITAPEWMEGRSLLPMTEGKPFEKRPVFSMQLIKNRVIGENRITKGTIAVWEGEYKLIHYLEDERSLLYNIKIDPDEEHNIIDDNPLVASRLVEVIRNSLSKAEQKRTQSPISTLQRDDLQKHAEFSG